jgi:hypothetical protein
MAEADQGADDFEFDPDQLSELSDLAEAFIHEELDGQFFEELDSNYLTRLVDSVESEPPAGVDVDEYEAAIEVAEFILNRMDAAEQ